MNSYRTILLNSVLFSGIKEEELDHIITCFCLSPYELRADDYVILAGNTIDYLYIILAGKVEIIKETYSGSRHIISLLGPSQMFGEGIVCTKSRISPVSVRTKMDTVLLKIPYQKIMTPCHSICGFHSRLIFNMMLMLGEKNYVLNEKMDFLMMKGMKEKIANFLLKEAKEQNRDRFSLSMNRNELADYLNVSRPSMSRELSRMQEDGLISFHKNEFWIRDKQGLTDCSEGG